ncbi:MAG TPA: MBL fold metallo-hydrolase [Planctomycetota bacterium]|nr:MBL fold metallo-hydrolase [Planctomycetota bacterium]
MKAKVRRIPVGPLGANCYLVWDDEAPAARSGERPCLVIDPGAEGGRILGLLAKDGLRPEIIAATHCHGDHIAAVDELLAAFPDADWAVGAPEAEWPARPALNLSYGFGLPMQVRPPKRLLRDGDELVVGCELRVVGGTDPQSATRDSQLSLRCLAVPGHSPGSIAYYCAAAGAVFTGDALFAGDIGRADLPGGDERQLVEAIRAKILTLPAETVVWPGHANRSRVGAEKKNNPYVRLSGD